MDLAPGVSGVGGLGDRHAQRLGVEAHLGNETRCAGMGLGNRSPQCLAVKHKSVELLGHTRLAAIQLRSRLSKPRTSIWTNSSRNVESDGSWAKSVAWSWLRICRWCLANRSIPTREPLPLRIERIATSSIHH